MPEHDTRSDGLFSLLPAPQQEQEQIRWRLAEDLDELYDALTEVPHQRSCTRTFVESDIPLETPTIA